MMGRVQEDETGTQGPEDSPFTCPSGGPEVACVRLAHLDCIVSCTTAAFTQEESPMSTKFVCFINPHTNKPMLVNPAHILTASEVDPQKVALIMDGGLRQEVEGDLKSVWETLTGEKAAL